MIARGLGLFLGASLALAAGVPIAARVVESRHGFPVPQLAAFSTVALLPWLLATGLILLSSPPGRLRLALAVPLLAVLAVQLGWLLPPAAARHARDVPAGGVPVSVLSLNARYGQADVAATLDAVRAHRVDVLVVEELTEPMAESLRSAGLGSALPYQNLLPEAGAGGTGIWSRWPLTREPPLPGDAHFAMPVATLRLPGERPLTVAGVHTRSPRRGSTDPWRADLATVAAWARGVTGPHLLAGDFNAGREHSGFRAITAAGLADAADARRLPWPQFTWPADRSFPPLTRIDHVLVSPELAVRRTRTVTVPGTDHRGVLADLVLRD